MGKTAFSGPLYGAKSFLWGGTFGATGLSTGASTANRTIAATVVPPYEDWYISEFKANFSTGSSGGNSFILKSEGGSSGLQRFQGQPSTVAQTLATLNSGTSTTFNGMLTLTPTAGEYEGVYVPAGSTLRLLSTSVNPLSNAGFGVQGFIRFIPSTRAEA